MCISGCYYNSLDRYMQRYVENWFQPIQRLDIQLPRIKIEEGENRKKREIERKKDKRIKEKQTHKLKIRH